MKKTFILNPLLRAFVKQNSSDLLLVEPLSKKKFELSDGKESFVKFMEFACEAKTKKEIVDFLTEEFSDDRKIIDLVFKNNFLIEADAQLEKDYQSTWAKHNWEDFWFFLNSTFDYKYIDDELKPSDRTKKREELFSKFLEEGKTPLGNMRKFIGEVSLLEPSENSTVNYFDAIFARRTIRKFNVQPITKQELSDLLYYSFSEIKKRKEFVSENIKENLWMFSNSHSLWFNLLVVVHNVEGVENGLYKYDYMNHSLLMIKKEEFSYEKIQEVAIGQNFMANVGISLFITLDFYNLFWRYRYPGAYKAALITNGELAQKIVTVAMTFELGSFLTPAIVDENQTKYLGTVPLVEEVIYYLGIGKYDKLQ